MEKKINIMTWNVDWFRNGKRSGKPNEYFEEDSSQEIYNSIVTKVKQYLQKENAIVFLQEVPYKAKNTGWHNHFQYNQLLNDFSLEKYDVFVNLDFACRCTMAIAVKNTFKELQSNYPRNNRIIAVESNDCIFMGVHMPTNFLLGDDNDKMWNQLIEYIETESTTKNIIIAGDFNVYIGCNDKLTEKKYQNLLSYMENCVAESIITFGKTSIDKLLLRKNSMQNIKEYKIQAQHDYEEGLSDHKYVCMEILVAM